MLSVRDVSLSFGGFKALDRVCLDAAPASITGIIGPNGSGKSTLLNIVAGVYVPDAGEVTLSGRPLAYGRPEQVAAAGIGRTFQVPRLAHRLTVFQNMMAGEREQVGEGVFSLFFRPGAVSTREGEIAERALAMLKRLGLAHKANDYAGSLSGGQQKLLTMGMLLMADPAVLLLDEPAAGVNPVLIEQQSALLHELKAEGRIVMLIEHNMDMIANVCDRVFVLDAGELIASGTPAEIRANERVARSYLGLPA